MVALLCPSLADAEARWSRSTMTAAATYFPAGTSAMVVGVGEPAQPVAAELLETLQATARFELVLDARALGVVDELDDLAIVERAFARPIQRVAIVRVFPAAGSVKAVVTVYAAQGQVTTAFTLAPGRTLADNPAPEAATDGVRRDEMLSVQAGTGDTTGGDDEITYKRQHVTGVTNYGVFTLENVNFFKNGRLISDTPSLYDALGMQQEARAYRSQASSYRSALKRGILMSSLGLTGVIGFGTWALVAGHDTYDYVNDTKVERSATVPLLLTAGSAVMMIAGIYALRADAPKNLTADEAVALVDKHNQRKHRAGGLGGSRLDVQLAPAALPSGAGFVLAGSF